MNISNNHLNDCKLSALKSKGFDLKIVMTLQNLISWMYAESHESLEESKRGKETGSDYKISV